MRSSFGNSSFASLWLTSTSRAGSPVGSPPRHLTPEPTPTTFASGFSGFRNWATAWRWAPSILAALAAANSIFFSCSDISDVSPYCPQDSLPVGLDEADRRDIDVVAIERPRHPLFRREPRLRNLLGH